MSLRSTIRQIEARDSDAAAIAFDKQDFIAQWSSELNTLYARIENDLIELVNDGLITFTQLMFNVSEESLSEYKAPGLCIKAASKEIYVSPIARITSGGQGRVDLYRTDRPSQSDRVSVVRRVQEDGSYIWMIEEKAKKEADLLPPHLFPQILRSTKTYVPVWSSSLEAALDYLLRL